MSTPKILYIEDSIEDVFVLKTCLDQLGEEYKLELLVDGEAALQYIDGYRRGTTEAEPCVILLDLNLPKHSGAEVLAALKQEPELAHVHVVVLTTAVSPRQRQEVESFGALLRIKPTKLDLVENLAADILALCKGNPQLSHLN